MNTKITKDTIACQNADMPAVNLDGEVGLMNINKGSYYCIDEVGTRIWELIETPKLVSDVINTLLKEYKIDKNTCEEHVLEFMNDLHLQDLISIN